MGKISFFFLIGEQLEEVNILGVVLSIRGRETIIELWFNYFGYEKIKNNVAKQFREFLLIDRGETVYFKDNKQRVL